MRKLAILLVLFFGIGAFICADSKPGLLEQKAFQFVFDSSSISFSNSISSLSRLFGDPQISVKEKQLQGYKNYVWDNLIVHVVASNDIIVALDIISDKIKTIDGIGIGDNLAKVKYFYGIPRVEKEKYITYYFSTFEETWNLVFYLKQGAVESIRMHRID